MSVNIIMYLSKYNQCKMLIFVEKDLAAVAHMADLDMIPYVKYRIV